MRSNAGAVGVVAAVVLMACLTSSAQASLGVGGFEGKRGEGYDIAGGSLYVPEAVAINATGNGGAPAGTNYVAERSNGRISQFGPSGAFVRAFGRGVVESGDSKAFEVQRLRVDATAGEYRLRVNGGFGSAHLTGGSNQVTDLSIAWGTFQVGDGFEILGFPPGALPPNTVITGIGPGTLQLSNAATAGGDRQVAAIQATDDIAATAPPSSVEDALEDLTRISEVGGTEVSGGPGNAGGTAPYLVRLLSHASDLQFRPLELTAIDGSIPLSGGAAMVDIGATGAGFEVCSANPPSNDVCRSGFGELHGVAVNQASGDVYATEAGRVLQFSGTGIFIRAFGQDVVESGPHNAVPTNAVQAVDIPSTVTGGTFTLAFGGKSTGPIPYDASVAAVQTELRSLASIGGENIEVGGGPGTVAPYSVTFVGELANNPEPLIAIDSTNLVGDVGTVTDTTTGVSPFETCGAIDTCKFGVSSSTLGGAMGGNDRIAIVPAGLPNSGNVLLAEPELKRVQEFKASGEFVRAFGFDVVSAGPGNSGPSGFEECKSGDACKEGSPGSSSGQFGSRTPNDIAVDSTGAIYTVESEANFRVQKFSPQVGPPGLAPAIFGSVNAPNGTSAETSPTYIAVGPADHVLVARPSPAGATATCPDGLPSKAEQRIQELSADGSSVLDTHMRCNGIAPTNGIAADPGSGRVMVSAPTTLFPTKDHLVYSLTTAGPPSVTLSTLSDATSTGAKVTASINPNSPTSFVNPVTTSYHLEYRLSETVSWIRAGSDTNVGAGTSPQAITAFLSGLAPNRAYDVRVVATKQFREGIVASSPQSFTTLPSAPSIDSVWTTDVTANSAILHTRINPFGESTQYRFEYGSTPAYGAVAPISGGELAAGPDSLEKTVKVFGLNGGTYHFRVIAENNSGTTTSADQTFSFFPPDCPNAHLRAQTGASYLPDCRAYELVSPANSANTTLLAEGPFAPEATTPSRFGFVGFFGYIDGTGEPAGVKDLYVATRYPDGWSTRYTGLPASMKPQSGPPLDAPGDLGSILTSADLSTILTWDQGAAGTYEGKTFDGSYAPYMVDTGDGSLAGRLPTNLDLVPGAAQDLSEGGFTGASAVSADLSQYVFSSRYVAFAPGGQTGAPGSVYRNNVVTGDVTLISKTSQGTDIPQDAGDAYEYIRIPAVSSDGSHVLMSTMGPGGNIHLYMAVGDSQHFDVSVGTDGLNHAVRYVGSTDGGEVVYMSSLDRLTADDHDNSADLFRWSEGEPDELTRVSTGSGGAGDTDNCTASWTQNCNAAPISTAFRSDNSIAGDSGDFYFYSPEQLVEGMGTPGERNLYFFSGGEVKFVATLVDGAKVNRIQVSPDGTYMALITAARLTPYDNTASNGICTPATFFDPATGPRCMEMYIYVPSRPQFTCASCAPDGAAPLDDVKGSQNGLFMTDDGRTFFSTTEPLVPQDTNGLIDSYEFVDSRPQLLSTGTAGRDESTGFIGVSANGLDAYFATRDSMVSLDTVGPFLKFYDARTGGGIPFDPGPAPCAAADECHGPASGPPANIVAGSSVPLGQGGNAPKQSKRKQKKGKKNRKKRGRTGGSHRKAHGRGSQRVKTARGLGR